MTHSKTTFADVDGIDESKAELVEIVDFLRRPEKYQCLGGRIPKGILPIGPPGTGKTLLAGREAILGIHARKVKLAPDVDLNTIAARTPGMVGAATLPT